QVMGLRFRLDGREVGLMLLVAVGVALVSAYLPARSASRTDILEAMRYE
ncbi:MAG: hypothetical protein IT323_15175, partial [Anaerolineae bacterium]|nr:hypothetical protein [Anaerolineae bacterium]